MKLTRRQVLAGAAAGALGAAGAYELVDRLAGASPERAAAAPLPPEQHVLDGVRTVTDNDVEVTVPPLHHEVVTARVKGDASDLAAAQHVLKDALAGLESDFEPTPAGLGVTVAWGLPYFERLVPGHGASTRRSTGARSGTRCSRARRFPSDPDSAILEQNDVAMLLRSDSLDHISEAAKALFDERAGLFEVTSIRKGFAGGGFGGGQSLPKKMALAAQIPGAELIPDTAELFLGFTSTQSKGLGPRKIVNFETLGLRRPPRRATSAKARTCISRTCPRSSTPGTSSSISTSASTRRSGRGSRSRTGTQTVPQAPDDVATVADVSSDFRRKGAIGHSSAIQTASRLQADHVARRRDRLLEGHRDPPPRRLQHARQPVLLERGSRARPHEQRAVRRSPLRRLQSLERRLRARAVSLWTASFPGGVQARPSRRATGARASTRCC